MPSTCVLLCRKGKVAVPFGQHNMAQLAASRMRLATLPGSYVARALEHGNNGVVAMYLGRYKGAHDEHAIALNLRLWRRARSCVAWRSARQRPGTPSTRPSATTWMRANLQTATP